MRDINDDILVQCDIKLISSGDHQNQTFSLFSLILKTYSKKETN